MVQGTATSSIPQRVATSTALFATGILSVAEIQNGPAEACALVSGSNSASPAPGQAEDAMARLGALLDDIFERQSDGQLNALPDCVWELFFFINELTVRESTE